MRRGCKTAAEDRGARRAAASTTHERLLGHGGTSRVDSRTTQRGHTWSRRLRTTIPSVLARARAGSGHSCGQSGRTRSEVRTRPTPLATRAWRSAGRRVDLADRCSSPFLTHQALRSMRSYPCNGTDSRTPNVSADSIRGSDLSICVAHMMHFLKACRLGLYGVCISAT